MPIKPLKPCKHQGCSEITNEKYCGKNRNLYRNKGKSASSRGYHSKLRKASKRYLKAHPLCVHCQLENKLTKATVVDHIIPHRGDPVLFWNDMCQANGWRSQQNMFTKHARILDNNNMRIDLR